jgi:hypothetical protein
VSGVIISAVISRKETSMKKNSSTVTTNELKSHIESSVKDLNDRLLKENGWDTDYFVLVKYSDEDRGTRLQTLIDLFLAEMTEDADQIRGGGLYDVVNAILKGKEVQADALAQSGDSKMPRWVVAHLLAKRIREHFLGLPYPSVILSPPSQDSEAATPA